MRVIDVMMPNFKKIDRFIGLFCIKLPMCINMLLNTLRCTFSGRQTEADGGILRTKLTTIFAS